MAPAEAVGLIDAGNNPQAKYDRCGCSCDRRGLQVIVDFIGFVTTFKEVTN